MVKITQLTTDSVPSLDDPIPMVDLTGSGIPTTKKTLWSSILSLFFGNVPTNAPGGDVDYVVSGGIWTGDSLGATRNASMSALVCRINGRLISIGAVTGRNFTASKDTYIDVLDNGDGTGTLVYTEVTNNAASPALASNSIRLGIIVTGASNIAAAGSINQGQEDKILPIASSTPYAVTDSLGNLICPRDPLHRLVGYRQITSNAPQTSSSATQVVGLSCPVILKAGRKYRIQIFCRDLFNATGSVYYSYSAWEGIVGSGSQIVSAQPGGAAGMATPVNAERPYTPSSGGAKTFNAALQTTGGTVNLDANGAYPAYIAVWEV